MWRGAAVMAVRINIHEDVADRILNVNEVPDLVETVGRAVLAQVIQETPVDTGAMKNKNFMRLYVRQFRHVRARIYNTDKAAWWVNRGTGIHNRDGSTGRIRPRRATVLRFPARNYPSDTADGYVYRSSVAGQEANEFMYRGLLKRTARSRQEWTVTKRVP